MEMLRYILDTGIFGIKKIFFTLKYLYYGRMIKVWKLFTLTNRMEILKSLWCETFKFCANDLPKFKNFSCL